MENERIINPQSYAHPFEVIMRDVFNCDRGGVGGIVDANFIRADPKAAIMATLTYVYRTANEEKRRKIEELITDVDFHFQFDFDTLLSFETSKKEIDGSTYELSYQNGADAIQDIKNRFREICK